MPKPPKLTAKQRLFIAEYGADHNATQAAIRSGYSETSARQVAAETMTNPVIGAAIERGVARQVKRADDRADTATDMMARRAGCDHTQILREDGSMRPVGEWSLELRDSIQNIRVRQVNLDSGDGATDTVCDLTFVDKLKATSELGRMTGCYPREAPVIVPVQILTWEK